MDISGRTRRWSRVVAAAALIVPGAALAQAPTTITGRVTSTAGAPLGDASVFIQSMGLGATTKDDGRYTVTIPAARVQGQQVSVTARIVGYHAASKVVTLTAGSIPLDLVLDVNPLQLGVVVVTGAGTESRVEQLGAVRNNVDSTAIVKSNEVNIVNALAGKAPNVQVVSSSGEPGSSAYIQLRGLTTLTASDGQPLIVVDGLPIDNATDQVPGFPPGTGSNGGATIAASTSNRATDINPDDIENIEVLKGAAAGAIYGSRAGQGVILITTKHGRAGETKYSLKSSTSWDNVSNTPYLQRQFGLGAGGIAGLCTVNGPVNCRAGRGSWGPQLGARVTTFDHATEMFTTGHTFDNDITIAGGNDRTTFFLSGANAYDRGFVTGNNNNFTRTSIRFNGSHQVATRFRVGANVNYVGENGNFVPSRNSTSSLLLGAWRTPPEFNNLPYKNSFGQPRSYRFPDPGPGTDQFSRTYDNPFFAANENRNNSTVGRAYGNLTAEYDALDWLKFNETLGSDYANDERINVFPWSASASALSQTFAPGIVTQAYIRTYQLDHNLTGTARFAIGSVLQGSVTLGQNLNVRDYNTQAVTGTALTTPHPFTISNTATQALPNTYRQRINLESYFGQAQAELWNQLTLTAGLRRDGASTFGKNNLYAWFPKYQAAWSVVRPEAHSTPLLSTAKLRLAYGQSGTQPPAYVLGSTLTSSAALNGDGFLVNGFSSGQNGQGGLYTQARAPNPDLRTERQTEYEAGADLGLLRDHVDFHVTYYEEHSTDVIFNRPVPPSTGFTQQAYNAGALMNHGWELSVNARPITTREFSWDVGVNWAHNHGNVTNLRGAQFVDLGGTNGLQGITGAAITGYQPGSYYGTDFARCGWGSVVNNVNIDQTVCQGKPKHALYLDATGFPVIDPTSHFIGDPNRNWTGSLHTAINIFKFTISGLLDIQNGGVSYDGTRGALNYFGKTLETQTNRGKNFVFGSNYWPGPVVGPGAGQSVTLGEGWYQGLDGVFSAPATAFIEPSGFAKLREISVAYRFDMPWIRGHTGFSNISLRLSGRNLHTWTDYKGIDPETSILGATSPIRGIDYFNIPQNRSYVLTVNLNR